MPLQKPKAIRAASERKHTAAGGESQVPWDGIHKWWKGEQEYRFTDRQSKPGFEWSLSFCSRETGAFKDCSVFSFKSVFVPILTYGHEFRLMTERTLS